MHQIVSSKMCTFLMPCILNLLLSHVFFRHNEIGLDLQGMAFVLLLKSRFLKKSFIMNAPLWVKHLLITFWWVQHSKSTKKWWLKCSTHKCAFIINDFLRNPHFRIACLLSNLHTYPIKRETEEPSQKVCVLYLLWQLQAENFFVHSNWDLLAWLSGQELR